MTIYVCLVYGRESDLKAHSTEDMAAVDRDSVAYDQALAASGRLVAAQALQSVTTAKTVRRRKGKVMVTDGPFAETKEQLLGFLMIEARSLDEALEVAGGVPLANIGTIEVRQVYDVPGR